MFETITNWFGDSSVPSLSEAQGRMYKSETTDNFRWAAKLFGDLSPYTLTSSDLADVALQSELAYIGQFAEVAHGKLSPDFIWRNMESLSQPGFPLEGYRALRGSELVSVFCGTVARLQGYIAYRPDTKQLVVAFSGTSCVTQALHNIDCRLTSYPGGNGCAVHAGFWRMYSGLRSLVRGKLAEARLERVVKEIVLTGHSLGAAMCYLLALDVLGGRQEDNTLPSNLFTSRPLKLAVFGCPRIGNTTLIQHWHEVADRFTVREYSVKGYNDGIPALPPRRLGYRHFAQEPLYYAEGCLYKIPPSQSEYSSFIVNPNPTEARKRSSDYPLGGHNYYNSRDMERLLREMKWINASGKDWEKLYRERVLQER